MIHNENFAESSKRETWMLGKCKAGGFKAFSWKMIAHNSLKLDAKSISDKYLGEGRL
jgi:hypothetical protein